MSKFPPGAATRRCPTCDGEGYYPSPGNPDPKGLCQSCNGSGHYVVFDELLATRLAQEAEEKIGSLLAACKFVMAHECQKSPCPECYMVAHNAVAKAEPK